MMSPKGKETKDMKKTSTRYFETAILREDGKKKGILYTGKSYGHAKWAAYHPGESLRIIITQYVVKHSADLSEIGMPTATAIRYDSVTDIIKHTVGTVWGTNREVDLYDVIKNTKAN